MRARGALVAVAFTAAVTLYGACTEVRLLPLVPEDGGAPWAGPGEGGSPGAERDAGGRRSDGGSADASDAGAWPCPPQSDAGVTLDREWMTGPLPPPSPGAEAYAVRTETVCDRTTLLEWERAVSTKFRTWGEAVAYCESLWLAGASDWRLPTRIGLVTIVDYARSKPSIDPTAFPGTPPDTFWSATLMSNVFQSPNAYLVGFDFGDAFPLAKRTLANVRCVRGGR